jgi:hypothetical protein
MRRLGCVILLLQSTLGTAGIAGFSKWFRGVFNDSVVTVAAGEREIFDVVCFDMNQSKRTVAVLHTGPVSSLGPVF